MSHPVYRLFVEKKSDFAVEARKLLAEWQHSLKLRNLEGLRIVKRYDVSHIDPELLDDAASGIFAEAPVDRLYREALPLKDTETVIAVEYLPGQYDQRADSAAQCLQLLGHSDRPLIRTATLYILDGSPDEGELSRIRHYCINPVEARPAALTKPATLDEAYPVPDTVARIPELRKADSETLENLREALGLAMSLEDLVCIRDYFCEEKRDPTITELRILDTYWSDHCRHTTFMTAINSVGFASGPAMSVIEASYREYQRLRSELYSDAKLAEKPECLMDIATIAMKKLRREGALDDLDESDEINACSVVIPVSLHDDGNTDTAFREEEWLLMFKNETHNHPTEIEPFGGAATCLGGAIRDPLSGRSYVYQAMRITGSGDPRTPLDRTLPGKLPQRTITREAARGYSSYGNQIGLATGLVRELYEPGYIAKRMEIGAVIGAVPRRNVRREKPQPGDRIILVGGRTGRDGCGGATGSSKAHTGESLVSCSAEVQKGNPPEERKLQRLFRKPALARMIKKCNDFGAGGVSVAIGELADSLDIELDAVPRKYAGLDGTELAISESQERMAVVVNEEDVPSFQSLAAEENLEATVVARVTTHGRIRMYWRKDCIVDISRDFLNSNGAPRATDLKVASPDPDTDFFSTFCFATERSDSASTSALWKDLLADVNVASQKGLGEQFDSSIGAGSILMPYGGEYQLSPEQVMAARIPTEKGTSSTASLMSWGFSPALSTWSPFHGAVYAVVQCVARLCAAGADYSRIRLSLQEYFQRLNDDPERWGKPFAALLGALHAQLALGIPAIGGKDSMSGSFQDLHVPPTLVAFGVTSSEEAMIIPGTFQTAQSRVIRLRLPRNEAGLPDFALFRKTLTAFHRAAAAGHILSASSLSEYGLAEALSRLAFGNKIGFSFQKGQPERELFTPAIGDIVAELSADCAPEELFPGLPVEFLGTTSSEQTITINSSKGETLDLEELIAIWESPLEEVFPQKAGGAPQASMTAEPAFHASADRARARTGIARPRVLIPVFPGTNCEYDSSRAFQAAGGDPQILVFRNRSSADIAESLAALEQAIAKSQIIMLPGGFSAGDEPDGAGKFIATVFRNPAIRDAVHRFLAEQDGLMLGICNGFQALVKLGLLPFGEIQPQNEDSPTLTFNTLNRHVATMVSTRVYSNRSPWLAENSPGDIHRVAVSHGEGRFTASSRLLAELEQSGQIATRYVDQDGKTALAPPENPNGSHDAIEGIISQDGRIFGKMGHSERHAPGLSKNIPGNKDQRLFESGIAYFQ